MTDTAHTAARSPWLFASLRGYRSRWLRADLVAGLTVWAVLVPEALAYAGIAGVAPVVGLYAAVPALVLYAAAGSSRHLIVGPMSATAALSAAIVAPLAGGDTSRYLALTTTLAIVTGVVGLLAALLRLGFIASFISEPVLKGFIVGLALTIIIGQVPTLIGIDKTDGNFFEQGWGILTDLGEVQWRAAALGTTALVLVLACKRWRPLVPGSLLAVLLGIVAVTVFDLDSKGVGIVGHIDPGLPAVGVPSNLGLPDYLELIGPAAGVLLIGFAEGLGAAKTYATKAGYSINADRELAGLGVANLGAGLCSGMVVNGSLSKTAVNGGAGARSQVSGLIVAALTILTLLLLTGLFENLPEATLAAVVIAAVIELIDIASLRRLYRVWTVRLGKIYGHAARVDFLAALTALLGVLIFDTLPGLILGIVVSMLLLLYRTSTPHLAMLAEDDNGNWVDLERHPHLHSPRSSVVVRVEAGLFFANADHVRTGIEGLCRADTRVVVLDAETSPFIDVTALNMLVDLDHALRQREIELRLARDIGQFRDVIATAPDRSLRVYPTVRAALDV
ncbi:SulP family inorganic anion transporter [Rhodococcus sp. C26F]